MNLIILAAGTGSRLFPLTKDTPKSLIDLGDGTTLMDRQINNAASCNSISKVYIVTGYRSNQIEEHVEELDFDVPVEVIYNPFFDISNNLLSLWCANHLMLTEDFIVTNGDNIYNTGIYDRITEGIQDTIQLTIDYKDQYDDDDMKVLIESGHIKRVSKKIPLEDADAESVGLVLVRGEAKRRLLHNKLIAMAKDMENRNNFWLELFNSMIADGDAIDTYEISPHDWGEVDFHPDVEAVKAAIFKDLF